jgi:hypothetical protein
MRNRVAAAVVSVTLLGVGAARAQTPSTQDTGPIALTPTAQCPQADIETLQRVITFVKAQSWAEKPRSVGFGLVPDTTACRVVLTIADNKLSNAEKAALRRGGENRLSIEERKDRAEPSRLPLLLWVVFGGAGLVFVYARYGRR